MVTPDNYKIGTLCIIDSKTKKLTSTQIEVLKAFAQNIIQIFELNLKNKALKKLATQYIDVQSMVQAGAWEFDVASGKTIGSSQVYKIFNIPEGENTLEHGISFYAPHERERLNNLILECISESKPFDGIFEFYDSASQKKWVRSVGRPLQDEAGKVVKIMGTFQDVTTQVEKEKNVSLILESITEGYFDWNIQTDQEYISPPFWKMLGYDPRLKTHQPKEWREILHPDDLQTILSAHEAHFTSKGKIPYEVEIRMRRSEGEYVWMRVSGKVIEWTSEGAPLRMIGVGREIQKEKELIERLKESTEYLDFALEGANLGIWDWYLTDNKVKYNERWASLRGASIDELKMDLSDWESRVHPDDLKSAYASINDYLNGKTDYFESLHRVKHKDGRWLFILGRGRYSAWDAAGKPTRFTGTDMDLTELVSTKQNLNQFFSLTLNYLCMANTSGYFTKVNSTWLTLGYSESELLSKPFIDFVHPNDLADTLLEMKKLSQGMTTVKFENRYLKKNGEYIHLEWSSTLDPDSGLIFAAATDVTERRKREDITQILSDVRSKFIEHSGEKKKFFDYILDKIIALTSSQYGFVGEILGSGDEKYLKTFSLTDISWNTETKAFFDKHNAAGLEFRNLSTLFGEVIKTGEFLIANDAPHHPKANGIPKGHPPLDTFMGVPLSYNGHAFAMIGVANNHAGYCMEDYHFLKPFFELVGEMIQTIKLSEELENQRRISLHNAKLASIGELAAGVGHEINNPLAIILGQIEMLKMQMESKDLLDTSFSAYFSKMIKGVERISNIVNGLRTFARMDINELKIFNLSDLIFETLEMLSEIYRNDGIKITMKIDRELSTHGNPGRLQQVLVNLLNNARDALGHSQFKELTISAAKVGATIIVKISDTGPGIEKHLREKIFEPFFTTKDVNKGTGIGLSLALSIIKDHQGELTLDTSAGQGATFIIKLPLHNTTDVDIKQPSIVTLKPQTKFTLGTVLVVDDEPDIREMLVYYLEKLNLKVISTSNGNEAIDLYKKHKAEIKLIISDMKMPEMTGADLAIQLRNNHNYQGGFFLVTGGVNFSEANCPTQINGIISKPFSTAKLQEVVKSWFGNL